MLLVGFSRVEIPMCTVNDPVFFFKQSSAMRIYYAHLNGQIALEELRRQTERRLYTVLLAPRLIYCPGEIVSPRLLASCGHPPANASPPFFPAKSFTRASSSGLKCLIRPCNGHAKASPSAQIV